jgi:hypothetical protein
VRAVCRSLRLPGTWRTNAHNVKLKSLCLDRPISELLLFSSRTAAHRNHRIEELLPCGVTRKSEPIADGEGIAKKNPGNQAGILFNQLIRSSTRKRELGSAALALVLVFFVLALAALLLLILLVLLTGLLAGLAAFLAGLTALSTLLLVLIPIICHDNSPPFKCASRRII